MGLAPSAKGKDAKNRAVKSARSARDRAKCRSMRKSPNRILKLKDPITCRRAPSPLFSLAVQETIPTQVPQLLDSTTHTRCSLAVQKTGDFRTVRLGTRTSSVAHSKRQRLCAPSLPLGSPTRNPHSQRAFLCALRAHRQFRLFGPSHSVASSTSSSSE